MSIPLVVILSGICIAPWHTRADESLDFDVDQLIASEKAWAASGPNAVEGVAKSIRVTLVGIRNNSGIVHILAYDDELAYRSGDYESAVAYIKSEAKRGTLTVNLNVGSAEKIALFAYHDENSDETLNKRGQIPEEAYGFSGNVNPYSQPSFEEASVMDDDITVRLVYMPRR